MVSGGMLIVVRPCRKCAASGPWIEMRLRVAESCTAQEDGGSVEYARRTEGGRKRTRGGIWEWWWRWWWGAGAGQTAVMAAF